MSINRRIFLKHAGMVIALPLFESLVGERAFASQLKNKFIGVFTPSGMRMPGGSNGNWTFEGALNPLVQAGLKPNLMIMRGITGGADTDPHWLNCAGFLSCKQIDISSRAKVVCGKSFDQYVAEKFPFPVRSLHVGWRNMNRDFQSDHATYSDLYLERVAWRADDQSIANLYDVRDLYGRIFSNSASGQKKLQTLRQRRKSVFDAVLSDLGSLKLNLMPSDRRRLEAYTESVRSVEQGIDVAPPACTIPGVINPVDRIANYLEHWSLAQKLVIGAFNCGVTNVATLMYDDGVGDVTLSYSGTGASTDHHYYAHNPSLTGTNAQSICENINRVHAGLFKDLVQGLKDQGLLDSTVVLWGSNMSDGETHNVGNLPMVIASGGSEFKLGQEVGNSGSVIKKADFFVELSKAYGMNFANFGGGYLASEGKVLGIFKS